jgi:hypothetical protein
MKKAFILFALSLFIFTAKSQFVVNGGDTIFANGSTSPTFEVVGDGSCTNNSSGSMTLKWRVIGDTAVPGWIYTGFCDKNLCYTYAIGLTKTFSLTAGASSPLQLHVTPGCNPGTGYVRFLLWNTADSAGTVQNCAFKVSLSQGATCTNGIAETEAPQISFYPNPVRSQLRLTLSQNINNGQIDIYNLIGSKVYSQSITSRDTTKDFDLANLETGIYVARISDNGKIIATKKFTKED